jgi:protein-disulfide isomerase
MRNFPLQQLHPNAPKLALAAECVSALGGNDAYWKFLASIIAQAPINTFFDMTKLDATAEGVGVSGTKFDSCVTNGTYQALITQQFNDAVAAGGQGTPYSVIILSKKMSDSTRKALVAIQAANPGVLLLSADGTQVGMSGSQPLATVKSIIDALLGS